MFIIKHKTLYLMKVTADKLKETDSLNSYNQQVLRKLQSPIHCILSKIIISESTMCYMMGCSRRLCYHFIVHDVREAITKSNPS